MQSTSPVWKWLWNEGGKNLPPSEYEGDIAAFDNPGYTYPKDITIAIEPVQSGSGDPSPDNVRPISGWTGMTVKRTGKNLINFNELNFGGTNPRVTDIYFDTILSGTYTFSGIISGNAIIRIQILNDKKSIKTVVLDDGNNKTFTIDESFNRFYCYISQNDYDNNKTASITNLQLELGSSATDYEPYTGTTYPISWETEAGTVYGGTLDVTTGLLTVDRAMVTCDGTNNWIQRWVAYTPCVFTLDNVFALPPQLVDITIPIIGCAGISNQYDWHPYDQDYEGKLSMWHIKEPDQNPGCAFSINQANRIFVKDNRFNSVDAFKDYLTEYPLQVCYELATPQTYQLTPTEVTLLLGDNNIWADTGDTSVALESPGHMRLEARTTVGGVAYTDISAPVITRALMQDRLSVGNVVSASLALAVRGAVNIPRSAAVAVEVRLNDGETASEWLPQGTFYISRRARDPVTGLLALECYDALLKANALWTPSAGAWPRTLAAVTAELAVLLGVTLDSRTVIPTGAAYAMSEPAEGTTIRDALSLVGQAAGGNWIITPAGRLRLVRLGEAGDTVDVAGVVGGIDVGQAGTITGVRSTVDGVATLTGDDTGIVVDVALAPVIAVELAEALIGQAWQPFRLDGAVYDPAAELGDAVNAGANGEVASALCSEQAAYGPAFRGDIAAPDPGEVTDEYPYLGSAERTLALAKAAANRAVERYDDNLTQQEIFNRLTDNGAAQGLVLYNGQLYVNASYVNAGRMNVGRIDFNEPESYYDVPDENDPDSLLSGQTVADGWIVNTSGSGNITVFSCGFAIPLRGKTITVTFAFNGNLNGGYDSWTSISDTANTMGGGHGWSMPSGQTPSNPYTYSVVVPDDVMSFRIAMKCAGVKQIEVSLDSPVTPSKSIVYDYEGQKFGEGNTLFQVYRDGTIITTAKSLFLAATRINNLYLNTPLDVASGGTGARNAANARANLEITPANIGAAISGNWGSTGNLDDLHTTGLYYVSGASATGFPQNNGKVYGGLINISNDAGTRTIQIVAGVFSMYIYYRKYVTDEGGWGAWKQATLT